MKRCFWSVLTKVALLESNCRCSRFRSLSPMPCSAVWRASAMICACFCLAATDRSCTALCVVVLWYVCWHTKQVELQRVAVDRQRESTRTKRTATNAARAANQTYCCRSVRAAMSAVWKRCWADGSCRLFRVSVGSKSSLLATSILLIAVVFCAGLLSRFDGCSTLLNVVCLS